MKFEPRDYLVISDVHLGARGTPASQIIQNLYTLFGHFDDKHPMAKIKAVFWGGDLWHDTLPFNSTVIHSFMPFWYAMLKWANRNKIAIRVLKGTPSHDRDQDATINEMVKASVVDVDYLYVSELSIEHMAALNMHVLYVPDECRATAQQIQDDIDGLLQEHHLQQVDIGILHGMFEHQLGTIPHNHKVLSTDYFLSIVRYYINIGHIHKSSQFGRILAQGSFDRISHNEEDPKGAYLLKEESLNTWIPIFIENKGAKQYKTVVVSDDVELAIQQIDEAAAKLPEGSHLRVSATASHPVFRSWETIRQKHPTLIWSKKPLAADNEKKERDRLLPKVQAGVSLNQDTLTEILHREVSQQKELSVEDSKYLFALLERLHT